MKLKMTYKKSTKNTHVYEDTSENSPLPTLYVKRGVLQPSDKPEAITVTVEPYTDET